jgi:hypothetical protein
LQESEEAKKAGGCPEHEEEPRTCRGPKLSSIGARVLFMTMRTNGLFLELVLGLGAECGPSTSSFETLRQVAQPGETL